MTAITSDRFLGGKLVARQPEHGFRAGLDAVMLAASIPAMRGQKVLELGAGCGIASLCLAVRVHDCAITGIEFDGELVQLARENAKANDMEDRVSFVHGDALAPTLRGEFEHAFANPPFHGEEGHVSPFPQRSTAKGDRTGLAIWIEAGLKRVRPRGTFSVIVRGDRLGEVLAVAPARGVCIFPLWPHQGEAAKRVIVQTTKSASSPSAVLAGLVLHERDGTYTTEADAVLRGDAALALAGQ